MILRGTRLRWSCFTRFECLSTCDDVNYLGLTVEIAFTVPEAILQVHSTWCEGFDGGAWES